MFLRIDQPLPAVAVPKNIYTMTCGDQLFVLVNGETSQQATNSIGADYPLVAGQVYAFDLASGEMSWPGPAIIGRRGIALAPPAEIPILVFVDRMPKRDEGGGSSKLRLLCVDKQTGATVYRNDSLPDTSGSRFRIRTVRGEPAVAVEMSERTVRLAFSDRPRSPEPPANDFVEVERTNRGGGLWGIGRRVGAALQEEIIEGAGGTNGRSRASERRGRANGRAIDDD